MADPPTESHTFLIADDHPMVRDALRTALAQAFPGQFTLWLGVGIVAFIAFVSFAAPLLGFHNPNEQHLLDALQPPSRAHPHEGRVHRDPMQPGGQAGRAREPIGGAEGGQEGILDRVTRVLFVAKDPPRDREQDGAVRADDRLAGGRVAPFEAGDEGLFRLPRDALRIAHRRCGPNLAQPLDAGG